ncbi:MAG: HlyD family secretion protein [Crocinitomicaceae bacterium]|jgi:HlyD family secretion protein
MTTRISLLATALCFSSAVAEDYELKKELFEQTLIIQGVATTDQGAEVIITPKVWADFVVEKVLPQGSKVAKGDQVVWIDTEKVDEYILDQELERKIDAINLQNAQQELAELKLKTERDMMLAKLNFEREQENYKYFREIGLPQSIAAKKLEGEKSKWYLSYTQEELTQLLKMYEADGLTEETEEIIVQRSQNSVKSGEFSNMQKQNEVKFSLETGLPRQSADRVLKHEVAKSAWEFAQVKIPRALEAKELEVSKLVREDKKKADKLVEVKADRAAMEIKAPAAGVLYYGEFIGSSWKREVAQKALIRGSKIPQKRVFMTVVPEGNATKIAASVDTFAAARLENGQDGRLKLKASPWKSFNSSVTSVAAAPNLQGKWDVVLSAKVDGKQKLAVGEPVKVDFVSYRKEDALSIPPKAVTQNSDGSFSVNLRMADDKEEKTTITLGESNSSRVEVLSGLSEGQVIIYDAK